jgi:hypothetical protein
MAKDTRRATLAALCWELVKHGNQGENSPPGAEISEFTLKGSRAGPDKTCFPISPLDWSHAIGVAQSIMADA